ITTFFAGSPTEAASLSRISSRALLVNVRQRTFSGFTRALISRPVRSVSVRVFPDPGPASVRIRPSLCDATCSCSGFNCADNLGALREVGEDTMESPNDQIRMTNECPPAKSQLVIGALGF